MILSGSWRINQLIQRRSDRKHRLQVVNMEIQDLKTYGQNIADGGVSIGEMMKTPTSMYNRQLLYMNTASQYCQMSATNQMQQLMATPYYQSMMSQQDAQVQQSYQQMLYQSFYKQAQNQFSKYEANLIHEKERAMEEEKESIKEEIEAIEGELSSTKQEVSKSIQEFFGGGRA